MGKFIKIVFLVSIIIMAVIPFRKKDVIDGPPKKFIEKVLVYYWVKNKPACINEQLLDNLSSAIQNGDNKSISVYLNRRFCVVNKNNLKITVINRGFNQTKFLYSGITFYSENSAILTKQVEI